MRYVVGIQRNVITSYGSLVLVVQRNKLVIQVNWKHNILVTVERVKNGGDAALSGPRLDSQIDH